MKSDGSCEGGREGTEEKQGRDGEDEERMKSDDSGEFREKLERRRQQRDEERWS